MLWWYIKGVEVKLYTFLTEVNGQLHSVATLPWAGNHWFPLNRRLHQGYSGHGGEGRSFWLWQELNSSRSTQGNLQSYASSYCSFVVVEKTTYAKNWRWISIFLDNQKNRRWKQSNKIEAGYQIKYISVHSMQLA